MHNYHALMLFTTALWFVFKAFPSDCLVLCDILFSVKGGKGASGVSCKTD